MLYKKDFIQQAAAELGQKDINKVSVQLRRVGETVEDEVV